MALAKKGVSCGWMDMFGMSPDAEALSQVLAGYKKIVTVEEHGAIGGLGSIISEIMCEFQVWRQLKKIACDTKAGYWYQYGSRENIERHYGLSISNIVKLAIMTE